MWGLHGCHSGPGLSEGKVPRHIAAVIGMAGMCWWVWNGEEVRDHVTPHRPG